MKQKKAGLEIRALSARMAAKTGARSGDRIVGVAGHPVRDELDYRFYAHGYRLAIEFFRPAEDRTWKSRIAGERALEFDFLPMKTRRCRNRCLFCFVDQLPRGMRPSLYLKDEDYRFSFLYGNYVTLASVTDEELERICRLRLEPLYLSVHATLPDVRNRLLGRRQSRDILEIIGMLSASRIQMHTQIVLCPGINDGEVLSKTVRDLWNYYPSVASVAVVPVGLTRHRARHDLAPLRRVGKRAAKETILQIKSLREELKVSCDDRFVFLADEFYHVAGLPFPPARDYGPFAQFENGVGMVPLFLREWKACRGKLRRVKASGGGRFLAVTGELAYPYVRACLDELRASGGVCVDLVPIRNQFLGRQVDVAGLITGKDIIGQLKRIARPGDTLLVPDVMLNADGKFLDDTTVSGLGEALDVSVVTFPPDPEGFWEVLKELGG